MKTISFDNRSEYTFGNPWVGFTPSLGVRYLFQRNMFVQKAPDSVVENVK